jgi:multiple sugar transport system ATP-binding protein
MNFVTVTVTKGPDGPQLRLPGGALLASPAAFRGALSTRIDQPVILGIRPEHVLQEPVRPQLQMQVDTVETLGAHRLLIGLVEGGAFTAQVPAGSTATEGGTAALSLDLQHLHLFDAATTQSLLGQA